MKALIKKLFNSIPRELIAALLLAPVWNFTAYNLSRVFNKGLEHYCMETALDAQIPLIPGFAFVYLGCFIFWIVNYCLACRGKEDTAWSFFSGDFLGKLICLIIFIALPTSFERPEACGDGFWQKVLAFVYAVDTPDNLFPSIHCLNSWFCFIAVRENEKIPFAYKVFSFIFAILVCFSTLAAKQHVFPDTIAGLLLAELCFQIAGRTGFFRLYKRAVSKILKGLKLA